MIREPARFATVGVAATLLHVLVALLAESMGLSPQLANASGFASALLLSYFGHGRLTFATRLDHGFHGPRFFAAALLGFAASAGLTQALAIWMCMPFVYVMGVVAVAVPIGNYFFCKVWVFRPAQSRSP